MTESTTVGEPGWDQRPCATPTGRGITTGSTHGAFPGLTRLRGSARTLGNMASVSRAPRHRVNVFQAIALLMAFLLASVGGGVLAAGLLMPAVATVGAVSEAGQTFFDDLPTELEIPAPSEQSRILAADGSTLAIFYAANRIMTTSDQISQNMKNAVVATEDKRFYEHKGVDPQGLARALFSNATGDSAQQGASTITQQYVKNVLIETGVQAGDEEAIAAAVEADGAEGYGRKLREMKFAISLEQIYTKDEILTGYLNIAQFGASNIYGVEAATQYFFGHSANEMTPAEAALVAGITKSPGWYDPTLADDAPVYEDTTNRRDTVLMLMHEQGYIDDAQYAEALATPVADMLHITPATAGCQTAGISAYFCEYVTKVLLYDGYLSDDVTTAREMLRRGGYTITTTIDPVRQVQAFDSLTERIPENDPSYNKVGNGVYGISGAISTVEPGTGNVIAMVQNTTYGEATEANPRATKVNFNVDADYGGGRGFQTGSTFKAFVLAQWLKDGKSLMQTVDASNGQTFPANTWNISCSPDSIAPYEPKNLEPGGGALSVLDSTRRSVNTAYAYMANQMDLCALRDTTNAMGVHVGEGTIDPSNLPENSSARALYSADGQDGENILAIPSMALGANTIAPLTMAAAFATFASNGVYCEPRSITAITDRDGNALEIPGSDCSQALDPAIASGVNYALQQVVSTAGSTGTGARLPGRPVAGKTGTANEDTHAWFIGYVPQLATAVWMGHSEGDIPMTRTVLNGRYHQQIYGGLIPAPIWGSYMAKATEGMEVIGFPEAAERQIWGERVRVPDVLGKSIDAARKILEEAGFKVTVGKEQFSPDVPLGFVAGQSSTFIVRGSVITLYPSAGPDPALAVPTPDPSQPGGGDQVGPPGGGGRDDRGGAGGTP